MTPDTYVQEVDNAVSFIKKQLKSFSPAIAITLGSGLGKVAQLIKPVITIPYAKIPHFPQTTVPGHEGTLIAGTLEGVPVIGLKGRKHYYEVAHEPNGMDQVVFPVHVSASLGCHTYIATNAAGGLNPRFKVGDLMLIRSHLDLFIQNPLLGAHHDFGSNLYFQPQSEIYNRPLGDLFKESNERIHEGVYACLTGRTYESTAIVWRYAFSGSTRSVCPQFRKSLLPPIGG
jgi:purine-nucleoside phosphorylase